MRQFKIANSFTNRISQSVDKYLTEISRKDLITAEEEIVLTKRIKEGDRAALDRLVTANLLFVVSVAKQYQNYNMTLGDLIDEGNLGLIKAAKRFDETKGFKFISYAVWWIRQSILMAIVDEGSTVRVPLNQVTDMRKVNHAYSTLQQNFEREPTHEEIAEMLGTPVDKISNTIGYSGNKIYLDAPCMLGDDGSATLLERLENEEKSPEHALITESLKNDLSKALLMLNEKQRTIIIHFYGLESNPALSLADIGEMLNISIPRVRQIRDIALDRLHHSRKANLLKAYL